MENNFGLFFTRNTQVIRLPVNPEKLPVSRDHDNGEYNVLGLGPIMVPRTPALKVVTISSFFPGRAFPGVLTPKGFQPPEFYINFFQQALDDKVPILYTPVRYYENGEPFMTSDTGFHVLVTQFNTEERGGETGDFYYDLTLTEYRNYSPQEISIQAPPAAPNSAAAGAVTAAVEPSREIPRGQLFVGAAAIANGRYYCSSYGDEPHGNANGRSVKVSRMVDPSRAYPIHITTESGGALGWIKKESLQVVSNEN